MAGRLQSVSLASVALAIVIVTACGGDDEPSVTSTPTPTATRTASTTNTPAVTPTLSIEEEVGTAYLAYWDAYAQAVLNLDTGLVEGSAAGEELASIRAEIETLQADGVALRVVVAHDFLVVPTSETAATVVDEVTNNSFYVNPVTKDPPEAEGSGELTRYTFFLERAGERWVVTRGLREEVD